MSRDVNVTIVSASYHRNGIGGLGFYAILFDEAEHGRMIASLFDQPGACAVYTLEGLNAGNIMFAHGNSWRGDVYEEVLRPALEVYLKAHGTHRAGPFGFPDDPPPA